MNIAIARQAQQGITAADATKGNVVAVLKQDRVERQIEVLDDRNTAQTIGAEGERVTGIGASIFTQALR